MAGKKRLKSKLPGVYQEIQAYYEQETPCPKKRGELIAKLIDAILPYRNRLLGQLLKRYWVTRKHVDADDLWSAAAEATMKTFDMAKGLPALDFEKILKSKIYYAMLGRVAQTFHKTKLEDELPTDEYGDLTSDLPVAPGWDQNEMDIEQEVDQRRLAQVVREVVENLSSDSKETLDQVYYLGICPSHARIRQGTKPLKQNGWHWRKKAEDEFVEALKERFNEAEIEQILDFLGAGEEQEDEYPDES